jgi:hypothetical protein
MGESNRWKVCGRRNAVHLCVFVNAKDAGAAITEAMRDSGYALEEITIVEPDLQRWL